MSNATSEKLSDIVFKQGFSNQLDHRVIVLVEYLQESGILNTVDEDHIFYPKNLFRENEEVELFFITGKDITICKLDDNKSVTIQNFSLESIYKLQLVNLNPNKRTVELIIHTVDGEPIHLSSGDTNDHWSKQFYSLILDIYAALK